MGFFIKEGLNAMAHASSHATWNPRWFFSCLGVALALYLSWFVWPTTRAGWDVVDYGFFHAANAALHASDVWVGIVAIINNRTFDTVQALCFTALFAIYIRAGAASAQPDGNSRMLERMAQCVLLAIMILIVAQLSRVYADYGRASPTMAIEGAFRVTEAVDWVKTKDSSGNSFPGDHGMVSLMFALFLWKMGGVRLGLLAVPVFLLATLPRTLAGAHWVTDTLVGGGMFALPIMALWLGTPLHAIISGALTRALKPLASFAERSFLTVTDPSRIRLASKGIAVGAADIIPGVSGGTMAYILGIYPQLVAAIARFNREWFGLLLRLRIGVALGQVPFAFLLPLAAGMVLAILLFTRMIPLPYFILHHPEPIYGLFFGLILASAALLVWRYARLRARDIALIAVGIVAGLAIVSAMPPATPDAGWFLFICGVLAICAMLLPGISGSFVLLILGKYALILEALGTLNAAILLPFIAGLVVGLFSFAQLLHYLLRRFYHVTLLFITGLLIGSLRAVWPFQERIYEVVRDKERLISSTPILPDAESLLGLPFVMMLLGIAIIALMHFLSGGGGGEKKKEQGV
jgi:putative membrane protein